MTGKTSSGLRYKLRVVDDRSAAESLPARCVARVGRTPFTSAYYSWSPTLESGWLVQRHGDTVLRLVDRASGRTLQVLTLPQANRIQRSLTVPEAGLVLFSTADPWTVLHRWNPATGRVESCAPGKSHPDAFAWHPGSRTLAWGTGHATILRRFSSGEVLHRMPPVGVCDKYDQGVVAGLGRLVFSPDGRYLAGNTVFYEHHWYNNIGGIITVYDAVAGKPLFEDGRYEKRVWDLRFSADSRALGIWFRSGPRPAVQIDVDSRREVPATAAFDPDPSVPHEQLEKDLAAADHALPEPMLDTRRLWISPDGSWLATDSELLRPRDDLRQSLEQASDRVFTPDGRALISADRECVKRTTLSSGTSRSLLTPTEGSEGQALAPDGRTMVRIAKSSRGKKRAVLTELRAGEQLGSWSLDVDPRVVSLSSHPTRLVLVGPKRQLRILDPIRGQRFQRTEIQWKHQVFRMALAAHGSTLVLGACLESEFVIVALPDLTRRMVPAPVDEGWVQSFAVSPSGTLVAVACKTPRIHLYRVADGVWLEPLEGHVDKVTALAFAADGVHLASVAKDGTALVWKVADKRAWKRPALSSRPA